ncbi:P-loop containing nucleoside triphosphatehydrolases superfamily protein [Striga asiatica]|uniref:P-loop containing nucleoside triphosphatehydrolases superfamily protein n=1 Tax=Striga asiatica TaxID=4170 RepID=A0A5A7P507_STRAF|nr:P-loop containing nucleoside triphosphatehydrolases superfamily protein [Striga asiatica]
MAVSFSSVPHPSSVFAAYASISAFIVLVQTMLNQLLPRQLRSYLSDTLRRYLLRPRHSRATLVVEERDGISFNELFSSAETYLCTKKLRPNVDRLKITKRPNHPTLTLRFAQSELIPDQFHDIDLHWRFVNADHRNHHHPSKSAVDHHHEDSSEKRFFELCFDKRHKERVLDSYIPFVMAAAKSIAEQNKVVKLHTLACASTYASWVSVNLEHPSTFNTLAIEPRLKKSIIEDLDRFVRRKDFYRKVGRVWKRGYLLYGPPGTGKSSLIAAMANYLRFDIYDLELTNVKRDSDLRRLLLRTGNRSILVIEDIDCTVELPERKGTKGPVSGDGQCCPYPPRDQQLTLSGLLNFIDGLWSSCGDERIIIFTTNNKDKLDPALLRPGRMDMHIHMSYLKPEGFKLLAQTYLDVPKHHPSLTEIEAVIKDMNVTPAEVAEELMKTDDVDVCLRGVLDFLLDKKSSKIENGELGQDN